MQYLVRKEQGDEILARFTAADMASAERKVKEWDAGAQLTSDKHFRYGSNGEYLFTVMSLGE